MYKAIFYNNAIIYKGTFLNSHNMKTLDDVRDYLSAIPYLHNGGCGIAAYAMYKWMVANDCLPKGFRIVFGTNYEDEHDNNKRAISDRSFIPVAPNHIFLRVNRKLIDAKGDVRHTKYIYLQYIKEKDIWFLIEAINNKRTWNSDFNRRRQIPRIEHNLNISLSEITT